ncbi:MAG: molybdopterin-dependent oxidoreductase [Candidatus Coatesbacteria bacterium]
MTRRTLLKLGAWGGLGALIPRIARGMVLTPREPALPPLDAEEFAPAICKFCTAQCMARIRLVRGEPVGVSGMPGHPVSRGALCAKGFMLLHELDHPDRLTTPVRRTGPRGKGGWKPVTWDEAHATLAARLGALRGRGRAAAFGMVAAPVRDVRHELQRRFAAAYGTPNYWEGEWRPGQPPFDAFRDIHGAGTLPAYDLEETKLLVGFGWDWLQQLPRHVDAQRHYAVLRQRQPGGGRIIQLEPRRSITAVKSDLWFPIMPGTEGVAALCIARALLAAGRHDRAFCDRRTSGFAEFRDLVLAGYPPERAERECGLSRKAVERVAMDMAEIRPCLAVTSRASAFNQSAVHALNLLTGSVGIPGGVREPAGSGPAPLLPGPLDGPRGRRLADLDGLARALLGGANSPLDTLWIEQVNPVFLGPDLRTWPAALARVPFTVCVSPILDETASLADLVLPPHASLETWQDAAASVNEGSEVRSFAPPVVKPRLQTGDLGDLVLRLGRSLSGGMVAALPWRSVESALQAAAEQAGAGRAWRVGGWRERESSRRANGGAGGLLRFPPTRPPAPADARAFPLRLHTYVPLAFSGGSGAHLPYLLSMAGSELSEQWETWMEIHPQTAKELGIGHGARVRVQSAAGMVRARARLSEDVLPGVATLPIGLGHTAMGRWAAGVGANPIELIGSGESWPQGEPVTVLAEGRRG